ncbi:DUF192 domain-containing protein [Haloarcula salina]|uniref:DUF192 domain-containing protein n=1 Tax=Haloarcula salina TaxID=1429914 RepID=UPI003C704445
MQRRLAVGIAVAAVAVAVVFGAATVLPGLWVDVVGVGDYEEGTVTIHDNTTPETATPIPCDRSPNATEVVACSDSRQLATVTVNISDTGRQRYVGLSETASLGPDEGMLFVHESEETHTYVMRNMSFPLDIIFVAENGTITTIHHAPTPPDGEQYSERYSGYGKYVLEVNRGWTNRTGVAVGDRVELPAEVA